MARGIGAEDLVKQNTNIAVYERLKSMTEKEGKCPAILAFWKYLLLCFETPRPSTDYVEPDTFSRLDRIREAVSAVAKALEAEVKEDSAGNLILRRAGRGAGADKPWICLQGHLDMVVSQNEGANHNFETDPIEVRFSSDEGLADGWLKPVKETTLGADNGVAIAACLAMLETMDNHPPIECLFTSNEETNFHGAENLTPGELKSKRLLNLDSEDEYAICIGSAGIFEHHYKLPVENSTRPPDSSSISVRLSGFHGGHSGVDINKGYGNANKLLARLMLTVCTSDRDIRLLEMSGGSGPTAIPREASCVIVVPKELETTICEEVSEEFTKCQEELNSMEPTMMLKLAVCSEEAAAQAASEPPPPVPEAPPPPPIPDMVPPVPVASVPRKKKGKGLMMSAWDCSRCERCVAKAIEAGSDLGVAERAGKTARQLDLGPLTPESTRKIWKFCNNVPSGVLRMSPDMAGLTESSVNFGVVTLKDDHLFCHLCVRSSMASFLDAYSQTLCAFGELAGVTNVEKVCPGAPWQPRLDSPLLSLLRRTHEEQFDGRKPHVSATHGGLEPGTLMESHPDLECCSIGPDVRNPHSPDERVNIASAERFVLWLQRVLETMARED